MLYILAHNKQALEASPLFYYFQEFVNAVPNSVHSSPESIPKGSFILVLGGESLRLVDTRNDITQVMGYIYSHNGYILLPCISPSDWYAFAGNPVIIEDITNKAIRYYRGERYAAEKLIINNKPQEVMDYLDACLASEEVCVDIETDGLSHKANLTAMGISKDPNSALCFTRDLPNWDEAMAKVKQIMESDAITKIGQNFINFDAQVLHFGSGISIYGPLWDTQDVHRFMYPDLIKRASLGFQAVLHLMCAPWKNDDYSAKGYKLRLYCARDVIRTFRIKEAQKAKMAMQSNLSYYKKVILPVGSAVARSISKGVNFDHDQKVGMMERVSQEEGRMRTELVEFARPHLPSKIIKKLKRDPVHDIQLDIPVEHENPQKMTKVDVLEIIKANGLCPKETYMAKKGDHTKYGLVPFKLYTKAYKEEAKSEQREFNPGSPQQKLAVFEALRIKIPQKRNAKGDWKPSTGDLELKRIAFNEGPGSKAGKLANMLLAYNPVNKFLNAYLKNMKFIDDGRFRSRFNLVGTNTSRSSSSKFFDEYCGNIQNIPSRGASAEFKKLFKPDPGYLFFNFDQSAAESRVVAYLAQCQRIIKLLEEGRDFHCETARALVGIEGDDEHIKKNHGDARTLAKPLNHGSSYDMGAFIMWTQFVKAGKNLSKEDVSAMLEKWHKAYPEIRANYHTDCKHLVDNKLPFVNPLGRRRTFTEPASETLYKKAYAEIPQSTIPAISNIMWNNVQTRWKDDEAMVLIQTHDSLSGQVREDLADEFKEWFINKGNSIKLTINGYEFTVPWEGNVGPDYYSVK